MLQHQRVDIDQADLEQMEAQHRQFLVLQLVCRHLAPFAEEDEAVGAVPVLDHVQSLLVPLGAHLACEIAAEENRLADFAQLGQGLVGRVLQFSAGEAAQDRFRFGRAQAQGRGVLDHLVVLPADQVPADGSGENRLEMGIVAGVSTWRAEYSLWR